MRSGFQGAKDSGSRIWGVTFYGVSGVYGCEERGAKGSVAGRGVFFCFVLAWCARFVFRHLQSVFAAYLLGSAVGAVNVRALWVCRRRI